jgi:carbamoyl-phosphate synthase large subunit
MIQLQGKRIFISGGAGVIGIALVKKLHKIGTILLVGDLKPRPKDFPKNISYRQGDLNCVTRDELVQFNPEVFFHLAATFERSEETYNFWEENYHHNVKLSNHLMTCLKDNKSLVKVIFASSYLIYNPELYNFEKPAQKAYRLKESDSIYPRNICGASKLLHEMELRFLSNFEKINFDTVSARIFRVYGRHSRDIISRWIKELLKGETIRVYKKEGLFDYIFADDVAKGLIKLAESSATGIVNLGNDNARRVEEVINILQSHFPELKKVDINLDIPYEASQANMTEFKNLTNWQPEYQLETGIPELIKFEQQFSNYKETNNAQINVLVSSVSKKILLIKLLKKAFLKLGNSGKIIGADSNSECLGKHFVDEFWEMPVLGSLDRNDFIRYCKVNKIKAIIPTRDEELQFFADNKELFDENKIKIMISGPNAIKTCLDKLIFYEAISPKGYPVVKTVKDINKLDSEYYVVKEQYGAGAKNIGLNLTKEQAVKHAKMLKNPVFQPFIKGDEISIDLYQDKTGKTKGIICRKRIKVIDGESQITETIRNPELEKLCSTLAEEIGLYGHVLFQVIVNDNSNHIIECNSRFGGASSLSLEVGLDSFYWFLLETTGENLTDYPFVRSKEEKKLIRYPEDLIL